MFFWREASGRAAKHAPHKDRSVKLCLGSSLSLWIQHTKMGLHILNANPPENIFNHRWDLLKAIEIKYLKMVMDIFAFFKSYTGHSQNDTT